MDLSKCTIFTIDDLVKGCEGDGKKVEEQERIKPRKFKLSEYYDSDKITLDKVSLKRIRDNIENMEGDPVIVETLKFG